MTRKVVARTTTTINTKIPDFLVAGDGTCQHLNDIPGLSDLLEVTVEGAAGCDPLLCTVVVTATWAGGGATRPKVPNPAWPHQT